MPKNIVFCADGTWDDPNDNSNVCQLYSALDVVPDVQLPIYDSGVGVGGNPFGKIFGGALGAGLFQKIRDGYSAIAAHYQPGDQIFLFGFSRGAYTARSLGGMIAICGLPTVNQNDPKCVDMAFEAYRNAAQRPTLLDSLKAAYKMDTAQIQLLGVWDTVGSLGIPAIFGGIDVCQYGFLDTTLHPNVLNAVQALAIDEERLQFQPALWTTSPSANQSLTQVWFTGVHCDIGGGYPPDADGSALSKITLYWMANYAQIYGLKFKPGAFPLKPQPSDALATMHDSRTGAFRIFPPHVRNIVPDSCIDSRAKDRCAAATSSYSPENLHIIAGALADTYNVVNV
jgi:uncharacterized protein (DUF2235 family)